MASNEIEVPNPTLLCWHLGGGKPKHNTVQSNQNPLRYKISQIQKGTRYLTYFIRNIVKMFGKTHRASKCNP